MDPGLAGPVGSVSAGGPVPAGCGQETGSSDGTVDAGGNDSLLSYYFSHVHFFFFCNTV